MNGSDRYGRAADRARAAAPGRRAPAFGLVLALGACAALLGVAAVRTASAQTADLVTWRAAFEEALAAVVRDHGAQVEAGPEAYLAALDGLAVAKQKAGDLDALLQVKAEQERFKRDRTVPLTSSVGTAPELQAIQEQHRQAVRKAGEDKTRRVLALAEQYTQRLNAQVTRLTQAGDIQGALACRAELERVRSTPDVAAAEFDRAAGGTPAGPASPTAQTPVVAPAGPTAACPVCRGSGKGQAACPTCSGSGLCGACGGRGKRAGLGSGTIMCVACRGSGKCKGCGGAAWMDGSGPCGACKGSGRVPMAETVKAVFDAPARYAGMQVLARARVARAQLRGTATASSVGTVSLVLREPAGEFQGESVLTREVPVLTAAAASRIAGLAAAATTDRLVLMLLLQVDGLGVAIRDVFPL